MNNPFSLENKLALITGGGTGIGFGMSKAIINAGGRVVITGRRVDVLKAACDKLGERATYMVHDITKFSTTPKLVNDIEGGIGSIDILINNAGVHLRKLLVETTDEEFSQVIQTHLSGSFALTRECAKYMIERKSGSVIFITSMAAIFGLPYVIAYTAAKSAVKGMVSGLATELSPSGIRVNAIAPGWIESVMLRKSFEGDTEREKKILNRMPMGRIGDPEDIGNAAVYLSSPAAKYITGVILPVDGGVSIGF